MPTLNEEQAAVVKGLVSRGDKQHDIAAYFGVNPARVGEIVKCKTFTNVQPAPQKDLPTMSAVASGFAVEMAKQALLRAKAGIDGAMAFLNDWETDRDRINQKVMSAVAAARGRKNGQH